MMKLNDWQRVALRTYGGGDYANLADEATLDREYLNDIGDTLAAFVIIELATSEDCNSWADAIERMLCAMNQLAELVGELEKADPGQ